MRSFRLSRSVAGLRARFHERAGQQVQRLSHLVKGGRRNCLRHGDETGHDDLVLRAVQRGGRVLDSVGQVELEVQLPRCFRAVPLAGKLEGRPKSNGKSRRRTRV